MPSDDAKRLEILARLREVLGIPVADHVMEYLPPMDWTDVARLSDIDERLTSLRAEMNAGFAVTNGRIDILRAEVGAMESRIDARFDALEGRIDGRFESIDGRFESIDGRFEAIDGRFAEVNGRLGALTDKLTTTQRMTWAVIGFHFALVTALVIEIFGAR
jgi:hypothetical protein